MNKDTEAYIQCDCHLTDHMAKFDYLAPTDFDNEPQLFLQILLNPEASFWKRLKIGLKYIFYPWRTSKFGSHFDELCISYKTACSIRTVLNNFIFADTIRYVRETKRGALEQLETIKQEEGGDPSK